MMDALATLGDVLVNGISPSYPPSSVTCGGAPAPFPDPLLATRIIPGRPPSWPSPRPEDCCILPFEDAVDAELPARAR